MKDSGKIYIFKNTWMPGVYKIGLTRGPIESRLKTLSTTSVPSAFECVESYDSDHVLQLEKYIHRKMRGVRCNSNREFFTFYNDEVAVERVDAAVKSFTPKEYTPSEKKAVKRAADVSTPSQQAKAAGLKSLTEVSIQTGVSLQTLINWHENKPRLFAVVLAGCAAGLLNKLKGK
jgi:hypothetical protein